MNAQELQTTLTRYVALREQAQQLEEERKQLSKALGAHMKQLGLDSLELTVGEQNYVVRRSLTTRIRYDTSILQQRLGPRYLHLLAVDHKKLKSCGDQLREWLGAHLLEVGSPRRQLVKEAVEKGLVKVEEFAGAFRREQRAVVSVTARSS
ncbi:MAG: hypothetical protein RBU37_21595 [Myxococcota bacterium]|nr:hypothetical protein [Myxococcota bacterium]